MPRKKYALVGFKNMKNIIKKLLLNRDKRRRENAKLNISTSKTSSKSLAEVCTFNKNINRAQNQMGETSIQTPSSNQLEPSIQTSEKNLGRWAGAASMAGRDKKDEGGAAGRPAARVAKNRLAADGKTKANFKLSVVQPPASPAAAAAPRPRGRPPARSKPQPKDAAAPGKTRGRKKADRTPAELGDEPDTAPEETDPKRPAPKPAVLRRIVKRKQLVSVLAKKKGMLTKRTLKTDIKKVNPRAIKKIVKLPVVKTEPETETDPEESAREETVLDPPPVEIKREPDAPDSPLPTSLESRSSSPRTGSTTRKPRTSSDLSIVMKSQETDLSSSPKGPRGDTQRSTRSERSASPFPTSTPTQKLLRNGKQRSLKNTLLTEVVEQESKKRRLISETKSDVPDASESGAKKVKRLRSHSKDGSEISKCDVPETDPNCSENAGAPDFEMKSTTPEIESETTIEPVEKPIEPPQRPEEEQSKTDETVVPDSTIDGDNNNSAKTDSEDAAISPSDISSESNFVEKIPEKSLILDNMSKTFNDSTLPEKSKTNIRRSARQRKSTVKAKEQEETIMAEKDTTDPESEAVLRILKDYGSDGDPKTAENSEESSADPKKFYGELPSTKTADESPPTNDAAVDSVESNPPLTFTMVRSCQRSTEAAPDVDAKLLEDCSDLNDDEDEKIDDSSKENIQNPYVGKSFTHHDIDKLIDKLKNFEEQDRKRQEMSKLNNPPEKRPVMVSNDVVLIPKSNLDAKTAKVAIEEKENLRKSSDSIGSPVSVVKKENARKSFEIDLPSGVTLIKRTGAASKKQSSGDSVTIIDKSLGKGVTLNVRKSMDKASAESSDPAPVANNIQTLPDSSKSTKVASPPKVPCDVVPKSESDSSEREPRPERQSTLLPNETPEQQKEKVEVLKTLGLLTLEAASQAKLDKQKQKELIKTNKNPILKYASNEGYTGTLKTVIKLNRPKSDKNKARSPLKMTFQKSKSRGNKFADPISGESESDENPCYTLLHKESGGSSGSGTGSSDNHLTSGGQRKTHYSNRFNNHELGPQDRVADSATELNPTSKETTTNLVIPEKASSFGIHPERLCQDQCFYCGGKFGLFDTPCHIAQIKSVDRQKKILDNEEKLTVDSCLCDACYRHVDRRANCPSYRKRSFPAATNTNIGDTCYANSCCRPAPHTLRRKWLVKIRRSISKVIQLDLDYPGLHTIPLCDKHYQAVSQLMVCGLCKRRLSRNHVHYINQEYQTLNPLLEEQGLPVVLDEKPVVCKLCRYFCTLLQRPYLMQQSNKKAFLKGYRRRLLVAHNIDVPDESDTDNTDEPSAPAELNADQNETAKEKKRGKAGKSKVKKSVDNKLPDENCIDKRNDSWKKLNNHTQGDSHTSQNSKMDIEDIESLISSNKIPVPALGLSKSDLTDSTTMDYDNPLIAVLDKQSELQNLLQKCNVPSSTILQRIGMSDPKSKNILKVHNAPAINKKKMNRNLRRIQKLGQIITQKDDFEETLNCKIPNREDFTIEPMTIGNIDITTRDNGAGLLRNIVLNDECTIETLPPKIPKTSADINSMKNKWQMTESFSQVKKNLSVLSKNLNSDHVKKRMTHGQNELSNPVRRLETNPSISVRELFPGEEEMNLQCSIEFSNLKGITPEGWEKCHSTIQYDKYTKNLWYELQKPYGNQSSFLRHLILLEKYFRNGDLVLSPNANSNAATYSESVQNRLRSFDNLPSNGDISYAYNLNNSSITKITHTATNSLPGHFDAVDYLKKNDGNEFRKPMLNISAGKSLLKSNQSTNSDIHKTSKSKNMKHGEQNVPKMLKGMPVSLTHLEKLGNQLKPVAIAPRPSTPKSDSIKSNESAKASMTPSPDVRTSTPKSDSVITRPRIPSLPPELIAINPQTATQKKSIEHVLKNIQMAKTITVNQSPQTTAISKSFSSISPVVVTSTKSSKSANVSKESKKGAKGSTKQWRPTLIPITNESKTRTSSDILHQTADGRRLPSLVQVMSGGKPYHITIEDYNKMCIMRREKLKLDKLKAELNKQSNDVSTESSTAAPIEAKPPSPDAEKSKCKDDSVAPKTSDAETIKPILPEIDTTSLLKNVALKNITIAPIITTTAASDAKTSSVTTVTPQSLLISSVVPSPAKTEVIPITSQAVLMPKIPKSLTVIPQSAVSVTPAATAPSTSPALAPLSVLPIATTITLTTPTVTASPSEP